MFYPNLVTSLIVPEMGHQDSNNLKSVQLTADKAEKESIASKSTENVDKKDVATETKD
jgi:hypothetical protein